MPLGIEDAGVEALAAVDWDDFNGATCGFFVFFFAIIHLTALISAQTVIKWLVVDNSVEERLLPKSKNWLKNLPFLESWRTNC